MRILGIIVTFLLVLSVCLSSAQERVIKEIVVFGNERVDKEIILKEIRSKVGEPFSKERVRDDIKAIYRLGYFRDVQVDVSETTGGIMLTFVVIEKPFVANIVITGNLKVKQEDIEGAIEVKKDSVLEMDKVRSSIKDIKKLYTSKRYFGSEVDYRVEFEEGNRAVVHFDIVEGRKGYLTKITFVGNHVLGARKLRGVMQTKKRGLLWLITKSGTLETDVLALDIERIKGLYYDHGYLTVKVSEPEITLSKDKKSIQITIKIEEGDQYRLASLDVQGDILTTKEALLKGFTSKVNKVYRSSLVQKDVQWLNDQYADRGYFYVDISPLTSLDNEKKLVHLVFNIQKGVVVFINRVDIVGNTKTRDRVIRRDLKIAEGDLYNATAIRKSRERLMRTSYFKAVDLTPSPTVQKELTDLDVKVEEAETGRLSFGAGYGSLTGVVGTVGLSQNNLFGYGYNANIRAEIGQRVRDYRFSFTDPRLFDSPWSVGFDVFKETYTYTYFSTDVEGGDIRFGREITDIIRADLTYVYERVDIYNVQSPPYEPGDYIYDNQGVNTVGKITLTVSRHTIDNPYNPTKGSDMFISESFAGLGGDNYFYSTSGGISWFHPLVGDLVLNLRADAGFMRPYKGTINMTQKFYVGGNNLRGFEYGMAGPVDEYEEPIGALYMTVGTVEFLYPLSKAIGLRGAVFYDIGKGWGGGIPGVDPVTESFLPLRHAVGVGIRWFSPFGPIRIDWGWNINEKPNRGEKSNAWNFNMGAMF